jgi:hypothetical protein
MPDDLRLSPCLSLTRSVRTGTFCVYQPDQPVRWWL